MTNREVISRVRVGLKSLTIDDRIPSKYIYDSMIDVFQLIIKREAESRKLYSSIELFTELDCVELTTVPDKKCGNLPIPCTNLSRSIKKLPRTLLSSNGSIMFVHSIDGFNFIRTHPHNYQAISNRQFKGDEKYYWVSSDNYLYVPDTTVKYVNVYILPESYKEVDEFNKTGECAPFLDNKSSIVQYWMEEITRSTIEKIANSYKKITTDEKSDLNEHSRA